MERCALECSYRIGGNYKDLEPPLQHTDNALDYIVKLGMTEVKNLLL